MTFLSFHTPLRDPANPRHHKFWQGKRNQSNNLTLETWNKSEIDRGWGDSQRERKRERIVKIMQRVVKKKKERDRDRVKRRMRKSQRERERKG